MTSPHEQLAAAVLNDWPVYIAVPPCDHPTCTDPAAGFFPPGKGRKMTLGELVDALHVHIREQHPSEVT